MNKKHDGCYTPDDEFVKQLTALFDKYPEQCSKYRQCVEEVQPHVPRDPSIDYLPAGLGPDGAPVEGGTPESITLARFELTNGNLFEFVGVKHEHEGAQVGVRELGGGPRDSAPTFPPYSDLSALEMYRKLAPEGAPIPELILETDEKVAKAATYETTKVIEDPVVVDLDERNLKSFETDSHYCIPGAGYNSFLSDFCDSASYPSNTWWWCDQEANYYWRDRWTTNHKRRVSFGITAACSGDAATAHYYKNIWGNWKHNKTWHLPSGYWQWTKWGPNGTTNRDRWIRHRAVLQGGSSFIRCVTFIYTP